MRTTRLKYPVLCRWANHHSKNFKPGDLEVTFELPAGLECHDVEHRRLTTRLSSTGHVDVVHLTYTNPLSGAKSRATVAKSYTEET